MKELSGQELKLFSKLYQSKYRKSEKLFLGEGFNFLTSFIDHQEWIHRIILRDGDLEFVSKVKDEFDIDKVRVASGKLFKEISDTDQPSSILVICNNLYMDYPFNLKVNGKYMYAFQIQDPGNLGTMIRSAAWFGLDGIILSKGCVDWTNSKVIRSTMGAFIDFPIYQDDDEYSILNNSGLHLYELHLKGEPIKNVLPQLPWCLIVGNESNGTLKLPKLKTNKVSIPGNINRIESLNAGVSVSIGCYEFTK